MSLLFYYLFLPSYLLFHNLSPDTCILQQYNTIGYFYLFTIYTGNRLKKFIKYNQFYKFVQTDTDLENSSENSSQAEESNQEEESETEEPSQKELNFQIVVPTLTAKERRQYVLYEEDDEGNLL